MLYEQWKKNRTLISFIKKISRFIIYFYHFLVRKTRLRWVSFVRLWNSTLKLSGLIIFHICVRVYSKLYWKKSYIQISERLCVNKLINIFELEHPRMIKTRWRSLPDFLPQDSHPYKLKNINNFGNTNFMHREII